MAGKPLKVSYCTTCKGRLHQLQETLRANMDAEKDNPNVEFVVLDYDSVDTLPDKISRPEDATRLGEWIKANFVDELASKRLIYARLDNHPEWEYAHAKNMAHRVATGDVLCNVDADNFIAPNFSRWLTSTFEKNPHSVATVCEVLPQTMLQRRVLNRLTRTKGPPSGTAGRVALSSDDFYRLKGYDERYSAYMGDDVNLVARGRDAKLEVVVIPSEQYGTALKHDNGLRIDNLSAADRARSEPILKLTRWQSHKRVAGDILKRPDPQANMDGKVGCGEVTINFADEPTIIGPLNLKTPWSEAQAAAAQTPEKTGPADESDAVAARRSDWTTSYSKPGTSAGRKL